MSNPVDPAVAKRVILALLDARDFLAYQLTAANGGMSDVEIDEMASQYLRHDTWTDEDLLVGIRSLVDLIPSSRLDADVISTVFHCDINQASRILIVAACEAAEDRD